MMSSSYTYGIQINFDNKKLINRLNSLSKKGDSKSMESLMENEFKIASRKVMRNIKQITPVDTGALKKSIRTYNGQYAVRKLLNSSTRKQNNLISKSDTGLIYVVNTGLRYSYYVEVGARGRKPALYFKNGAYSEIDKLESRLKTTFEEALLELTKVR